MNQLKTFTGPNARKHAEVCAERVRAGLGSTLYARGEHYPPIPHTVTVDRGSAGWIVWAELGPNRVGVR